MAVFRTTPLVLSLAAIWSAPSLAQTQAPDVPIVLETVEVTAHRVSKSLAETAPNASVISRHKLDDQLSRDIADVIKYEPGVSVAHDPARRGNAGYTIRGMDGNRILMLIDGIRLPESYTGGGNNGGAIAGRDFVELESLRAIDIVKGPSSSLYGSDALGGVVGYRTLTVDDLLSGETNYGGWIKGFGASADRSWGSSVAAGIKGEQADAMVLYTHRKGKETNNKGDNDSASVLRTQSNPQQWQSNNVLTKFGFSPSAQQRLELVLEHYQRDTDTHVLNSLTSSLKDQTASDRTQRDRASLGWTGQQLGWFDRLSFKVYHQKQDNADNSWENRAGNVRRESLYGFEQTLKGFSLDAEHRFSAWQAEHQLLWGADINRIETSRLRNKIQFNANGSTTNFIGGELYPNKTFPDSRSDRIGLFVQDEIKFGNGLIASPAVRWDSYKMTPETDQAFINGNPKGYAVPSFKDHAFSPKLGLSLPFAQYYTGFLQLSSGFRAPPFDDANMAFSNTAYGYTTIPNPQLKSERSRGAELGLKAQWQDVNLALTTFYNRYSDFIDLAYLGRQNGLLSYQYQNIGKVVIKGAEARASWRISPAWRADASLAYARGEDTERQLPLSSIDPLSLKLGINYKQAQWGGEAYWRLAKATTRLPPTTELGTNEPAFKAPGYGVLDLTAYWEPAKNLTLRAGLFNVLDKKYWQASDVRGRASSDAAIDLFTQPGRNVSASVEYRF